MDIYRIGTYHIPLEGWIAAEHYPFDGIGTEYLVGEETDIESKSAMEASSLNIYGTGRYLTPLYSWEGAEQCPIDRRGISYLVVEESGVDSKGASIDTNLITEANPMNIHRVGTYLIPLEGWEGAGHCPRDRIGIRHLVVEKSGVESKGARIDTSLKTEANSMDIHRVGTYLIPLES